MPLEWYRDHDHFGYDLEGKPIKKPEGEDAIDKLLNQADSPWYIIVSEIMAYFVKVRVQ